MNVILVICIAILTIFLYTIMFMKVSKCRLQEVMECLGCEDCYWPWIVGMIVLALTIAALCQQLDLTSILCSAGITIGVFLTTLLILNGKLVASGMCAITVLGIVATWLYCVKEGIIICYLFVTFCVVTGLILFLLVLVMCNSRITCLPPRERIEQQFTRTRIPVPRRRKRTELPFDRMRTDVDVFEQSRFE